MRKKLIHIASLAVFIALFGQSALGQSTEFTYQGRLLSGGVPANGTHDFEFRLFRDSNGNELVGTPRALTDVNVNNGVFSVRLDFGDEFPGENRYLEIRVRQAGQQFFTVLAPLQAITSAPYAIKSLNAENATTSTNSANAAQLGGVDATQYVLTVDPRMTDARTPLPNSPSYIQNTSTPQNADFNVSGFGTIGGTLTAFRVTATQQFNIGSDRILANTGTNNIFAGAGAGFMNAAGTNNSFVGRQAGEFNSGGGYNSFFGSQTGAGNTTGSNNSVFGAGANLAGGLTNATAIGFRAYVGQSNSLVLGSINGVNGATADTRVGIGTAAPSAKLTISGDGAFNASTAARFDLFNTTANVGYFQHVLNDGRWQLGSGNQTRILVDTAGNVGIGTGPTSKLTADGEITSSGATGGRFAANNPNNQNARVLLDWLNDGTMDWPRIRYGGSGQGSASGFLIQGPNDSTKLAVLNNGTVNIPGNLTVGGTLNANLPADSQNYIQNTTTMQQSSNFHIGGNGTVGLTLQGKHINATSEYSIGGTPILSMPQSTSNLLLGGGSQIGGSLSFATAIGANAVVTTSNTIQLGRLGGNDTVNVSGRLRVGILGSSGGNSLCRNAINELAACSSSIRYKGNVKPFTSGVELIKRLRPVLFKWKDTGITDFGLIAEETGEVEPLLVTRNTNEEIEGVKYDRVGVVLVNAVQEQQHKIDEQKKEIQGQRDLILNQTTQIDDLKKQIRQQTDLLERLRRVVCDSNHNEDVCKKGSDHD